MNEALQRKLETLPDGPGVYLWRDATGTVIYVGKPRTSAAGCDRTSPPILTIR